MFQLFISAIFAVLLAIQSHAVQSPAAIEFQTFDELLIALLSQIETFDPGEIQSLEKLSTQQLKAKLFATLEEEKKKSIFITDLDRTLMQSANYSGRVEWFWDYHAPQLRSKFLKTFPTMSIEKIERKVDKAFWNFAQSRPQVSDVDKEYTQLLIALQDRGHVVLALTARRAELIPVTLRQLDSLGLKLGRHAQPFLQKVKPLISIPIVDSSVIFSEMNDFGSTKGEMLAMLHHAAGDYSRVVFFDDRNREIIAALEAREKYGILSKKLVILKSRLAEFHKKKEPYHQRFYSVALIQEEILQKEGRWISNHEAMNILIQTQGSKFFRCFDLFYLTD